MKLKSFLILLTFLCLFACGQSAENADTNTPIENIEVAPDILENNDRSSKLDSYKWRGYTDIVEQLYKEAMKKNNKLKELNEQIQNFPKKQQDSLDTYTDYTQINTHYYTTVMQRIGQIKDSLVRKDLQKLILGHQNAFEKNMRNHKQLIAEINHKSSQLNEELLIMKILVSEKMMRNYQNDEIPDIRAIKNLNKEYDALLDAAAEFSAIPKGMNGG